MYVAEDQNRPSTEPSSLLKIRRYRNEIRPQRRNNGLQEPEMAKRQLEEFRISAEIRKGLEYIANLAPKKRVVRLNGMQESNELESQFQQRLITSALPQSVQRISANGLENTRNPNNPPIQRLSNLKKMEHEYLREYPRQKQNNPRTCYSVPAERENGSMAMDQQQQLQQFQHQILPQQQFPVSQNSSKLSYNERNHLLPRTNSTSYRFDASYPQHYQQMQQYYQNSKNLARNHGEGDMGSTQRIEQNKGNFDHAGGDASENMNNGAVHGQMTDGKIPYQRVYYSQPDIHESRTIGGVRYLARKQDYMPNQ